MKTDDHPQNRQQNNIQRVWQTISTAYDTRNDRPYEHLLDANMTFPSGKQTNNPRLFQMQVSTLQVSTRGMKDAFIEFEHLLRKQLRLMSNRLTQ